MSIFNSSPAPQAQKLSVASATGTPINTAPASASAVLSDDEVSRAYETERKRHAALRDRKITEEANRKRAQSDLDALRAEMQATYGTSDVKELKAQLEKRRVERQAMLEDVRRANDAVEAALTELAQVRESA